MQTADLAHPFAELDVGAAAGHVGGDGHPAVLSGPGDDLGLPVMLLGVEHLVLDLLLFQHRRDLLGDIDGDGADQDRPALPRAAA